MLKKTFIILVLSLVIAPLFAITPYNERRDNFQAIVKSSVTNLGNELEYRYEILYDINNPRRLSIINIDFSKDVGRENFIEFSGEADRNMEWTGGIYKAVEHNYINFTVRGEKGKPYKPEKIIKIPPRLRLATREDSLNAGERLILKMRVKNISVMTGVATLFAYCEGAMWVYDDASEAKGIDSGFHPKEFTVIGPVAKPTAPKGMVILMLSNTALAYEQGWINKQDVYQGLIDKLNAAKEKIDAGSAHYHTAKNILNAYKHLLDAQRGKAIDESTHTMLTVNADTLIGML